MRITDSPAGPGSQETLLREQLLFVERNSECSKRAQFRVRSSALSRKLLDTTCGFVPYGSNPCQKVIVKEYHSFLGEGFVLVLTAYSTRRTPGRCLEFEPDHLFLRIFEPDA